MPNQYVNKVVSNNVVKIDLTSDTVTASSMLYGVVAHDASGATITGSIADGDSLGYGTGDATRPIVGIGTVNSMVI